MMRVEWTQNAISDLAAIYEYITSVPLLAGKQCFVLRDVKHSSRRATVSVDVNLFQHCLRASSGTSFD